MIDPKKHNTLCEKARENDRIMRTEAEQIYRNNTLCARATLYPNRTHEEVIKILDDMEKKEKKNSEGFINETELEFKDISSEKEREYLQFDVDHPLVIEGEPLYLNTSNSGGHRLYTSAKWCYYVQPREGWAIRWKVKEGQPSFVK